jgi:hypothetical protein
MERPFFGSGGKKPTRRRSLLADAHTAFYVHTFSRHPGGNRRAIT